jgi:hypothetical protein
MTCAEYIEYLGGPRRQSVTEMATAAKHALACATCRDMIMACYYAKTPAERAALDAEVLPDVEAVQRALATDPEL